MSKFWLRLLEAFRPYSLIMYQTPSGEGGGTPPLFHYFNSNVHGLEKNLNLCKYMRLNFDSWSCVLFAYFLMT